jgi:hypothetical protein
LPLASATARRRHVERTFDSPAVLARVEQCTRRHREASRVAWLILHRCASWVLGRSFYGLHGYGGLDATCTILVRHHLAEGWHVTVVTRTPVTGPASIRGVGGCCRIIQRVMSVSWTTARSRSRAGRARRFSIAARPTPGLAGAPAAWPREIVASARPT